MSEARVTQLEGLIRELLAALDRQHFAGRPPGTYTYSLRVDDAMRKARKAVQLPPALSPDDEATVA